MGPVYGAHIPRDNSMTSDLGPRGSISLGMWAQGAYFTTTEQGCGLYFFDIGGLTSLHASVHASTHDT